jgi:hypothetical protein
MAAAVAPAPAIEAVFSNSRRDTFMHPPVNESRAEQGVSCN